ncbi:flagellar biosynthesis anti-sigma factor FlgM [Granulicella sp. dw_53]|uniref:flagellar biosynthesis anti-sigma factor FlgM n=1 Tax=Granulicella sp. dw_53 TaxID=2719792 RepID=UPI001BD67C56|nr:flagellar biosynthesis anti-sigma factor FlgM [Granulicella sp. dw_53]
MNFSGNIVNTQSSVNSLGTEPLNITPQSGESNQSIARVQGASTSFLGADSATLTPAAAMVQSMADSDVPSARIASIQKSIEAGTYNIPASAVAEKVVESMVR